MCSGCSTRCPRTCAGGCRARARPARPPEDRLDEPPSLPLADLRGFSSLRGSGVWRYGTAIPVDAGIGARLSLGEGQTPLLDSGEDGVSVKLEFLSPTGSFKDRGAVVLVARALQVGAATLVADSSGNAGSA